MPTLTGTAHWAKVHEAANSPRYPDNYQYSIDIGPLSVDDIAELTAQGLADKIVHDHAKKDYTPCITFKHPPIVTGKQAFLSTDTLQTLAQINN